MKTFKPRDFISEERLNRVKSFAKGKETPFLVMDLDVVSRKYDELKSILPMVKVYYAVKANPMDEILKLLAAKGSNFDIATRFELDQLLNLGVSPSRLSFGNTIKKEKDIQYAYAKGIRLFVSDSHNDLMKLARSAPGSKVFFRLSVSDISSEWPLSRKFGTDKVTALKLIRKAKDSGLVPYGLSFHVGSQKTTSTVWSDAIYKSHQVFLEAEKLGIKLKMLNLGGGLPANYYSPQIKGDSFEMILKPYSTKEYERSIKNALYDVFGKNIPEILIEPGRSMTGDAGIIVSEIVLISRKKDIRRKMDDDFTYAHGRKRITLNPMKLDVNEQKWVYFDIGKFGGLAETLDESINYPIHVERKGAPERVILAGPTCDSADILYEKHPYYLPADIKEGDKVFILSTGAYTQSYSAIGFNGIPPLKAYILPKRQKRPHGKR